MNWCRRRLPEGLFTLLAMLSFATAQTLTCNSPTVDFTGGLPSDWEVVDNEAGSPTLWATIDGCGEAGNYTSGAGDAVCASSSFTGPAPFDTELRTAELYLNAGGAAVLSYFMNYQNFAGLDVLDLDLSTDGGASWVNLLRFNEDFGGFRASPGALVVANLSDHAGQVVVLRWRYYDPNGGADFDLYAQLDEVELSCSFTGAIDLETTVVPDPTPVDHSDDLDICNATVASDDLKILAGTRVIYCYEVTNNTNARLQFHDLTDSELGVLFDGRSAQLLPGARSQAAQGTVVAATVTASSNWTAFNDPPGDQASDSDTTTVTVVAETDLGVAMTDGVDPAQAGRTLVYTVTVTNLGSAEALETELRNELPESAGFVSATPEKGSCQHDAGTVICALGDIPAGSAVEVVVVVMPTVAGSIANSVTVSSFTDTNPVNDRVVETTTIEPAPAALVAARGASSPPDVSEAAAGDQGVPMVQFTLAPMAGSEAVLLEAVELAATGTGDDAADVAGVDLYLDANSDGAVDGGDILLASGTFSIDDGGLTLAPTTPVELTGQHFLISLDLASTLAPLPLGGLVAALPLLGLALLRRRAGTRLALLSLSLALGLIACNPSPGGQQDPRSYTVTVESLAAVGSDSGALASVEGLPLSGTTLTVED